MIKQLRKEIDGVDDKIIGLLSKRIDLAKKIASIKKEQNQSIIDKQRERKIIERLKKIAKEKNLDEKFVASLYSAILENSRNEQESS